MNLPIPLFPYFPFLSFIGNFHLTVYVGLFFGTILYCNWLRICFSYLMMNSLRVKKIKSQWISSPWWFTQTWPSRITCGINIEWSPSLSWCRDGSISFPLEWYRRSKAHKKNLKRVNVCIHLTCIYIIFYVLYIKYLCMYITFYIFFIFCFVPWYVFISQISFSQIAKIWSEIDRTIYISLEARNLVSLHFCLILMFDSYAQIAKLGKVPRKATWCGGRDLL